MVRCEPAYADCATVDGFLGEESMTMALFDNSECASILTPIVSGTAAGRPML